MRSGRGAAASIVLAIIFFSFSAGFLTGRLTAGETFTVTAQYAQANVGIPATSPGNPDGKAVTDKSEETAEPAGQAVSEDPAALEGPININIAGAELLTALPNIGATRAESIIAYREENGPFRNVADLMQVPGIGEAIYEKLKDKITTGDSQ